jgi:hypothetical protein
VELRDSYPTTMLRVVIRPVGMEQTFYVDYPIWSDMWEDDVGPADAPDVRRMSPEGMVGDILLWLYEPGDPRPWVYPLPAPPGNDALEDWEREGGDADRGPHDLPE